MSAWIAPDSNTHSGYHFVEANWDAFHADEEWHRGPEVRMYDPAVNKVVTMRLLDICHALWAAQAMLAERCEYPDAGFESFDEMCSWATDGEMFAEHTDETCEQNSIAGAAQVTTPAEPPAAAERDRIVDIVDGVLSQTREVNGGELESVMTIYTPRGLAVLCANALLSGRAASPSGGGER